MILSWISWRKHVMNQYPLLLASRLPKSRSIEMEPLLLLRRRRPRRRLFQWWSIFPGAIISRLLQASVV